MWWIVEKGDCFFNKYTGFSFKWKDGGPGGTGIVFWAWRHVNQKQCMDLDIKEITIKKVFETIIGNSSWTGY